jgi:DNA-binding NtrC family response regulator
MKVLVVHDERAAANSIAEILYRNGHGSLPLYSLVDVIEHAEELAFDVALITRRPNQSFLDLGDYLQKLMPQCKIIFALGPDILWLAQGLLKRGIVKEFEYLPGSFKTADLLQKLAEIESQCALHRKATVFSGSAEKF